MARHVIALLGGKPVITEEGQATEAITPGYLIKGQTSIAKQTVSATKVPVRVALERDELGNTIDDDYAIGDTVKVGAFHAGQRFYGFVASGETVAVDALLESAGDGTIQALAGAEPIVRAVDAVTGNVGVVDVRLRVEVI